jgi:seryl-tRNA synthetase
MHNLKEIRKDFSGFEKSLEKRSIKIDFENLKKLDEQNRDLIQKKEALEKEKKDISKSKDEKVYLKNLKKFL